MKTITDVLVLNHMNSARALLESGLMQMKKESYDEYQAIALAAKQGAFFQIHTSLSPAGLCEASIELVAPGGQIVNLMRVEGVA